MRDAPRQATDAVHELLRMHGGQPRHRANRLLFVAADQAVLGRLKDATRVALAWESIVEDVDEDRLNIDQNQRKQAEKEAQAAAAVLPRAARECFRWLLCPVQDDPKADRPTVVVDGGDKPGKTGQVAPAKPKSFQGSIDVPAANAKVKLVQIAEEIVKLLASDPHAAVRVTVEIEADFATGVSDTLKRSVTENATTLGFKTRDWE